MSEEIIHYGVLGMKWGRRKDRGDSAVSNKSSEDHSSDDAKSASASREKAKTKGLSSLSNKELRDLNERMNLEQNYSRLTSESKTKGRDVVGSIIKGVELADDLTRTVSAIPNIGKLPGANHRSVKIGRQILTGAVFAADVAKKIRR